MLTQITLTFTLLLRLKSDDQFQWAFMLTILLISYALQLSLGKLYNTQGCALITSLLLWFCFYLAFAFTLNLFISFYFIIFHLILFFPAFGNICISLLTYKNHALQFHLYKVQSKAKTNLLRKTRNKIPKQVMQYTPLCNLLFLLNNSWNSSHITLYRPT